MELADKSYSDDIFPADGDRYRVKLREVGNPESIRRSVIFKVTPELSETRSVNYKTVDPIHGPGSIYTYVNTSSRSYNLSGIKLVSRNREEATRNLARLNLIRSWCMPTFGSYTDNNGVVVSTNNGFDPFRNQNIDVLGAPPKVLEFSAYSDDEHPGNINRIPVVITQLSINYPSDVDYIPTAEVPSIPSVVIGTPVPIVFTIDINLSETHSPVEYSKFSIADFRNGILRGF